MCAGRILKDDLHKEMNPFNVDVCIRRQVKLHSALPSPQTLYVSLFASNELFATKAGFPE